MTLLTLIADIVQWTPEWVLDRGKAWIDTVGGLLETAIAKIGVIAMALIALISNIRTRALQERMNEKLDKQKADVEAMKDRQDRQAKRIDNVALAATVTADNPVKAEIINTEDNPVPVQAEPEPMQPPKTTGIIPPV